MGSFSDNTAKSIITQVMNGISDSTSVALCGVSLAYFILVAMLVFHLARRITVFSAQGGQRDGSLKTFTSSSSGAGDEGKKKNGGGGIGSANKSNDSRDSNEDGAGSLKIDLDFVHDEKSAFISELFSVRGHWEPVQYTRMHFSHVFTLAGRKNLFAMLVPYC